MCAHQSDLFERTKKVSPDFKGYNCLLGNNLEIITAGIPYVFPGNWAFVVEPLLFIVIRDWNRPVQYLKQVTGLSLKKQIRDSRHEFSIIPICFNLGKGSEEEKIQGGGPPPPGLVFFTREKQIYP